MAYSPTGGNFYHRPPHNNPTAGNFYHRPAAGHHVSGGNAGFPTGPPVTSTGIGGGNFDWGAAANYDAPVHPNHPAHPMHPANRGASIASALAMLRNTRHAATAVGAYNPGNQPDEGNFPGTPAREFGDSYYNSAHMPTTNPGEGAGWNFRDGQWHIDPLGGGGGGLTKPASLPPTVLSILGRLGLGHPAVGNQPDEGNFPGGPSTVTYAGNQPDEGNFPMAPAHNPIANLIRNLHR